MRVASSTFLEHEFTTAIGANDVAFAFHVQVNARMSQGSLAAVTRDLFAFDFNPICFAHSLLHCLFAFNRGRGDAPLFGGTAAPFG